METTLTAVEMTGMIDEAQHLHLDTVLPIRGPRRVRVIVLYPPEEELSETTWLHTAARNPAFDFLHDPEEDIYSLADGKPFHDEV
ncbi:MAG: hypothetical protein R3E79_35705 [Caldilineaceae bacterium]